MERKSHTMIFLHQKKYSYYPPALVKIPRKKLD